jgi:hypothetical protein
MFTFRPDPRVLAKLQETRKISLTLDFSDHRIASLSVIPQNSIEKQSKEFKSPSKPSGYAIHLSVVKLVQGAHEITSYDIDDIKYTEPTHDRLSIRFAIGSIMKTAVETSQNLLLNALKFLGGIGGLFMICKSIFKRTRGQEPVTKTNIAD